MNRGNRDIWWTSRYTLLYGGIRDINRGTHFCKNVLSWESL